MQAASASIEATTSSDMKQAIHDNMDNRSICSSVASSMKNAELIMAAFSCSSTNNNNPMALTIEEEDEELDLEQMGKSETEVSESQASSGELIDTSGLINNSNDFTSFENDKNEVSIDNSNSDDNILVSDSEVSKQDIEDMDKDQLLTDVPINPEEDEFDLNDLMDETIANVASGSFSQATKKSIAKNQRLQNKNQEKPYFKLKKLREKEQKKKALKRLERIKQLERDRALKKRQKEELKEKKKSKLKKQVDEEPNNENERDQKKKSQLKLSFKPSKPIESEERVFKAGRGKKQQASTLTAVGKSKGKQAKATGRQTKVKQRQAEPEIASEEEEEAELIFEPNTGSYSNEQEHGSNEEKDEGSALDAHEESSQEPTSVNSSSAYMKRQCLVCKRKMHQDRLNDHCSKHYYESAKCSDCDKVSTNPSNYVTHLLSHLPSQFFCTKCNKWFRQPIVYRRHQNECAETGNHIPSDLNGRANTSIKRKASAQSASEIFIEPSATISDTQQQDNKRIRRVRTPTVFDTKPAINVPAVKVKSEPVVPPVKRKQGRPRKEPLPIIPISEIKQEPKKKIKKEKVELIEATDEDSKKSFDEPLSKSLRPRNSLSKTKSEGAKISTTLVQQNTIESPRITRKKSDRLSSVSSNMSTTSSITKKQYKTKNSIDKQAKQLVENSNNTTEDNNNSPLNSNRSDQNDIDDLNISEYDMDDDENSKFEEPSNPAKQFTDNKINKQSTAESVDSKYNGAREAEALKALANNTNLASCPTYKVKIQLRRPSNNSSFFKQKENTENHDNNNNISKSEPPQTPSKLNNSTFFEPIKLQATPSKSELVNSSNSFNNSSVTNSSNSHTFECPECDKKFVSPYGLFQHYDQHPNLAVSCTKCQINFENHQALIAHKKKLHPDFLSEFNEFKNKQKIMSGIKPSSNGAINNGSGPTGRSQTSSAKQGLNFQAKSKSTSDADVMAAAVSNPNVNDLSALPSIMTRTSRLGNGNGDRNNNSTGLNNNSSAANIAASIKTAAAISNHRLDFKTTGFADLAFIDFSCMNFPRIAQNYCELWPRKPSNSSDLIQQQIQPLHNYSCDRCGFYFPSSASLALHQKKKVLASSKINKQLKYAADLSDNQLKHQETPCPLFMTNSKFLCYEKCLDEIITRVESIVDTDRSPKKDFLKLFGLVEKQSPQQLTTDYCSSSAFIAKTANKLKYIDSSLVSYVTPNHISVDPAEDLLSRLRRQMYKINHQFIIDLDRWKLMHSSDSSLLVDVEFVDASKYSNKIHLKPHVNLNRPLLIRSKKMKRNSKKNLSQSRLIDMDSPRQQPFRSAQLLPTANSISDKMNLAITKNLPQIPQIQAPKTSSDKDNKAIPKLSKPLFPATSGSLNASNISATTSSKAAKAESPQPATYANKYKKKRKLTEPEPEVIPEPIVVTKKTKKKQQLELKKSEHKEEKQQNNKNAQTQANKKRKKQRSPSPILSPSDSPSEEEILVLNETDVDDDEFNYYDEDEVKDSKFQANIKFSKPVNPNSTAAAAVTNGTSNAKNPANFSSGMNTNQPLKKTKLPQPPTLYKAPTNNNINMAIFTSANSSILANASGMNNSLVKKNMPKLLPATNKNSTAANHSNSTNSAGLNHQRSSNQSELALMPKLKPASTVTGGQKNVNRAILSKPPQLIMPESNKAPKQTNSNTKIPTKQQASMANESVPSNSKATPKNSKANSNSKANTSDVSLKCKFCFQIFEGQPEFFQHVINSHPKMLEQRLNRPNSAATTTTTNSTSTKAAGSGKVTNTRVANSNGNSNHSNSSVGSGSMNDKK